MWRPAAVYRCGLPRNERYRYRGPAYWLLTDAVSLLIQPRTIWEPTLPQRPNAALGALSAPWEHLGSAAGGYYCRAEGRSALWLTGHSLGAAWPCWPGGLKRKFVPVHQIYTYGGPMVETPCRGGVDHQFRAYAAILAHPTVPLLPTVSLLANQYSHCQAETVLGEASEAAAGFLQGLAPKSVDGVIHGTLFDEIWSGAQARLAAHAMENYRSLVAKLVK